MVQPKIIFKYKIVRCKDRNCRQVFTSSAKTTVKCPYCRTTDKILTKTSGLNIHLLAHTPYCSQAVSLCKYFKRPQLYTNFIDANKEAVNIKLNGE